MSAFLQAAHLRSFHVAPFPHCSYLEEVSSCNIFAVKGKKITTPPLQGTILPGVTRRYVGGRRGKEGPA